MGDLSFGGAQSEVGLRSGLTSEALWRRFGGLTPSHSERHAYFASAPLLIRGRRGWRSNVVAGDRQHRSVEYETE